MGADMLESSQVKSQTIRMFPLSKKKQNSQNQPIQIIFPQNYYTSY